MDKIDQLVLPISAPGSGASSGNVTNMRVEGGGAAVWIATTACMLSLVVAWNTNQRVSDLRADMQAESVKREIQNKWTAQEITAIRSYITTGKLAPMNPPPIVEPKKEPK